MSHQNIFKYNNTPQSEELFFYFSIHKILQHEKKKGIISRPFDKNLKQVKNQGDIDEEFIKTIHSLDIDLSSEGYKKILIFFTMMDNGKNILFLKHLQGVKLS